MRKRSLPATRTDYPSGTFIKTERGYFLVVREGKRYRIITKRVLNSWSPQRVIRTTEAAVQHLRVASRLKFRNGSLIHSIADGKIYLIVDSKRCHMTSPEAFERLGITPGRKHVTSVSMEEINLHSVGEEIA